MLLEATNLLKVFKGRPPVTAVNDVTFSLAEGRILGLLGPNGAGKTTTIQILMSVLKPTAGRVMYFGKDLARDRSEALQQVGYASAYTYLPVLLTVRENLEVYGRLYGMPAQDRKESMTRLLRFFGAEKLLNKQIFALSAGQRTRVMLAKAFLSRPKIVLLDEPTASLDPEIAHEVRSFVLDQRKQHGVAMVYSSHNMDEVTEVCDEVIFLNHGSIIARDRPAKLAATLLNTVLRLTVIAGRDNLIELLRAREMKFEETPHDFVITTDETTLAALLGEIALKGVRYSHIAIERPSLEDYFLHVAKTFKKGSGGNA